MFRKLSKSVLETLSVVAFKAPVLQSTVIAVRTNKAYDHLSLLEKAGYITREKQGRSMLIKLTKKFFLYFDIPPEKLKEKFSNLEQLEKVIEQKEKEFASKNLEESDLHLESSSELEEKEPLHEKSEGWIVEDGDHEDKIEAYSEKEEIEEKQDLQDAAPVVSSAGKKESIWEEETPEKVKEETHRLFENLPEDEISKIVDEKVEKIIHPEKE